ncbi:MAG TPA: class I SAM-dependent methyltransferase [Bryobacteraceae bacterium]|nr:class I SAM-dependent methyltransferase [Bryobacteraceae bacterium]
MTALVKGALDRLGLAPLAFRTRERLRAVRFRRRAVRAPDGLPIPPARLMVLVTGSADTRWYVHGGKLAAESILETLDQAGVAPADFHSVLDFGCGCGRVIRQWKSFEIKELHGSDYNRELVEWCRKNLPFAKFQSNTLEPHLRYADHQFEFAYALSVLTHTPETLQQPWIDELWRILRPGGYLLITTQGAEFLQKLSVSERDRFRQGELVVRYDQAAGTNLCSVYHPEKYVREKLASKFTIAASRPGAATGNGNQDIYLLGKPG